MFGHHVAGIVRGARLEHEGWVAQRRGHVKDTEVSLVGCIGDTVVWRDLSQCREWPRS